jgi:hypothetical protein
MMKKRTAFYFFILFLVISFLVFGIKLAVENQDETTTIDVVESVTVSDVADDAEPVAQNQQMIDSITTMMPIIVAVIVAITVTGSFIRRMF